jgi:competence protein ComEC
LLERLNDDLRGAPIDLLWITHPHSDHLGGVPEVLEAFAVTTYADNGRDTGKAEVRRARRAAEDRGVAMRTVDPDHPDAPIASGPTVTITPVLPSKWPASCAHDANECSIALRIDFGASSVLFTGDAEHAEETTLDPHGPVTLLQVGHHGSDTSTTPVFLARAKPKYAVISAGKPGEGLNREYCHPRAAIVRRLTRWMGGKASKTVLAFDGLRCDRATTADWIAEPASENLWVTARSVPPAHSSHAPLAGLAPFPRSRLAAFSRLPPGSPCGQDDAQQLVRTSLLDCVHNLLTHFGRLQRINPRPC